MSIPQRIRDQAGRYALVDGIPFKLPVTCNESPVLMALFPINADKAAKLIPGNEVHPIRFRNKGLLVVTVIDYRKTVIGKYIEYSIAIACNHGADTKEFSLSDMVTKGIDIGQYVVELPVSSEISVKGGKGIWGMPKHQGSLNFNIGDNLVSSQYDLDGQLCTYVEIEKPAHTMLPLKMSAANFCAFRGMLMKSYVYFEGKAGICLLDHAKARFVIGDHPRVQPLKDLEIGEQPLMTAFIPSANGILDDHFESWFLSEDQPPKVAPEGMESVIQLGLSEAWLPGPTALVPGKPVT
jgi:hypothetical protein